MGNRYIMGMCAYMVMGISLLVYVNNLIFLDLEVTKDWTNQRNCLCGACVFYNPYQVHLAMGEKVNYSRWHSQHHLGRKRFFPMWKRTVEYITAFAQTSKLFGHLLERLNICYQLLPLWFLSQIRLVLSLGFYSH